MKKKRVCVKFPDDPGNRPIAVAPRLNKYLKQTPFFTKPICILFVYNLVTFKKNWYVKKCIFTKMKKGIKFNLS